MKSYFKFLRRNKAYTLIDVLGLALSMMFIVLIGGYTWQETHIDSDQSKLDRMYVLGMDMEGQKITGNHWRMIQRLVDQFPEIETGTAIVGSHRTLKTPDNEKITSNVLFVDSTFYDIFDFELIRGDRSKVLASPNSIVVTEEYARKIWKDEDPMGKSLVYNVNEDPLVVTGIMAPMENTSILSPDPDHVRNPVDALIPMEMVKYYNWSLYAENMQNAIGSEVVLLARDGADLKANEQRYNDFAKEFYWILQLPEGGITMELVPFKERYFSEYRSINGSLASGNRKMVKLLFSTGLAILLFALMNYVNLTVALSGQRAKEMATRRLLGDSRAGIILKLIGESTLLCAISSVIGLLLAWLALPYAENLLQTGISLKACVTPATISILVGIILLMGILAGVIPAMLISSAKPIDVVRGAFRRHTKMIFSKIFIVVQNVVTITMIAAALTMYLQINHIIDAPLGYNTDNIMYINNGGDQTQAALFLQRVEQLPGVEMVSAACSHPLDGGNNNTMTYEGRTISFQSFIGDKNYLKILGIGLQRDNKTADVVKQYLNRQAMNELGLADDATSYTYYDSNPQIAGILNDFHIGTIIDTQHPVRIEITPMDNVYPWGFLIKVNGDPVETLRKVKEVFKDVFQWEYEDSRPYLRQQIEDRFISERNLMKIITIFAAIAVVISLLGLVAMSTYFVQQRRKEIAVKKVLGCDTSDMLRRLVLSFMAYVAIAFIIAIPVIYWLMNDWLSGFSYRIPLYWWIYLVAGLACILVSVMSVYIQSYRAAAENPVNALYQN
jgi:putative ABC transport system permease protein